MRITHKGCLSLCNNLFCGLCLSHLTKSKGPNSSTCVSWTQETTNKSGQEEPRHNKMKTIILFFSFLLHQMSTNFWCKEKQQPSHSSLEDPSCSPGVVTGTEDYCSTSMPWRLRWDISQLKPIINASNRTPLMPPCPLDLCVPSQLLAHTQNVVQTIKKLKISWHWLDGGEEKRTLFIISVLASQIRNLALFN